MYPAVLGVHNALRWAIIGAGLWVVFLSWRGWVQGAVWTRREAMASRIFVGLLDLQLLVGVLLYAAVAALRRVLVPWHASARERPPGL